MMGVFVIFMLAVLVRMVDWQIVRAVRPSEVSAQTIDLSRGRIVDRQGLLLATDTLTWDIYAGPARLPKRQELARSSPRSLTKSAFPARR